MKKEVEYARKITEPIVRRFLENKGYIIEQSSVNEDYDGIDLIAFHYKTNSHTNIDVKCPCDDNKHNACVYYTTINGMGKSYKQKKTDYVVYVDTIKRELIFIDFVTLKLLLSTTIEYDSKYNNGKYAWLNKEILKKLGKVYKY